LSLPEKISLWNQSMYIILFDIVISKSKKLREWSLSLLLPWSLIVTDIVMQDLKTECINKFDFYLTLYYWYEDDILLAAPTDKNLILESFNNYHERLKFTIEHEKDRSLSFLDLLITISNNIIYPSKNNGQIEKHPICVCLFYYAFLNPYP